MTTITLLKSAQLRRKEQLSCFPCSRHNTGRSHKKRRPGVDSYFWAAEPAEYITRRHCTSECLLSHNLLSCLWHWRIKVTDVAGLNVQAEVSMACFLGFRSQKGKNGSVRVLPICQSVLTFCKICSLHYCNQYYIFLLQNIGHRLSDVVGQYNDSVTLETVP